MARGEIKTLAFADGVSVSAGIPSPIGNGGGGGGSATWNPPDGSGAPRTQEQGELVYLYPDGEDSHLFLFVRVPSSYSAGDQINMDIGLYSPSSSGTVKMMTTTYLIRANNDGIGAVANSHDSTNAALTNTSGDMYRTTTLDLTDADGEINNVAVSAGDLLRVDLYRDHANDTDTGVVRFVPNATAVRFSE